MRLARMTMAILGLGGVALGPPQLGCYADKEEDDEDAGGGSEGGADIVSSECAKCQIKNESDAKHCKGCGARLGGVPESDDDEPPPDSEKPGKSAALPAASAANVEAMLPQGMSVVAMRTAVIPLERCARYAMSITGTTSIDAAMGGLKALADDATRVPGLVAKLDREARRNDWRDRMGALRRLASANLPGFARGDLFVDEERDGRKVTRPVAEYADMPLASLKAMVDRKIKGAPASARRNPFEPDRAGAEAKLGATGITDNDRAVALRNGLDPERIAASRRALFPNANGASGAGVL